VPLPPNEADPAWEAEARATGWTVSLAELPAAPPQPWLAQRPGVPAGRVELHRLRDRRRGEERRVWVYTPPDSPARAGGPPAGVLLLFDGWLYRHLVPTPTILDNLLAAGAVPPLVAVLVDTPQATRSRDLRCEPRFADFVVEECLPWVRERYRVAAGPATTVVGGASYGGLAAGYLALRHPEVFGGMLAQSGSFYWPAGDDEYEWLARQLAARPRLPLRFALDVGRFDTTPRPVDCPTILLANRHLRDVLRAKGYPVHYAEFAGGHDHLCWRGTLADALVALAGPG
jgi:enterochelin esterase family protein